MADLIRRTRESIATQQELLARLRRIGEAEPADWADVLRTVALLRGLGSESAGRRQRAVLTSGDDVPVAALVEAALREPDPNVAGALRWALARAGDDGLPLLADGLGADAADVRERAVRCVAEIPGGAATDLLRGALTHSDVAIRRTAATALAGRGVADGIPVLVEMIVDESPGADAEAADALAGLAADPALARRIANDLVAALAGGGPGARRRLTQALADIPGSAASHALEALSRDEDRVVAATAAYTRELRDTQ